MTTPNTPKDDDVLEINLNHLTIGEIETIEDKIDAPIDSLQDPKMRKGKVLRAIAYVLGQREDPNFTWEQAGNKRVAFSAAPVPNSESATS